MSLGNRAEGLFFVVALEYGGEGGRRRRGVFAAMAALLASWDSSGGRVIIG